MSSESAHPLSPRRVTPISVIGLVVAIAAGIAISGLTWPGHADATSESAKAAANVPEPGAKPDITVAAASTSVASLPPADTRKELEVRRGDTLMSILLGAGVDRHEAHGAITALREVYDPRNLMPGQQVTLTISADDELKALALDETAERRVAALRVGPGSFRSQETKKILTRKVARAAGTISSSLYNAAVAQDIPPSVLAELIRIYSWDVDFQREVQEGDAFEIAYENYLDESGEIVRHGSILFAALTLSGDRKPLYRFEYGKDGVDYFDDTGASARKPLMRTPVDGARLSSRYGKRRHPILGYTKVHRGVDFAASRGTPIYAAGDGVVTSRGHNGGYGRYIRVRHNGRYSTAYGHMSRYHPKVTSGSRVRQGQVIGYVGSTGRSTGPHLHFEIIVDGRQVNPLTVRMPSGRKLKDDLLARFQTERAATDDMLAELRGNTQISAR